MSRASSISCAPPALAKRARAVGAHIPGCGISPSSLRQVERRQMNASDCCSAELVLVCRDCGASRTELWGCTAYSLAAGMGGFLSTSLSVCHPEAIAASFIGFEEGANKPCHHGVAAEQS